MFFHGGNRCNLCIVRKDTFRNTVIYSIRQWLREHFSRYFNKFRRNFIRFCSLLIVYIFEKLINFRSGYIIKLEMFYSLWIVKILHYFKYARMITIMLHLLVNDDVIFQGICLRNKVARLLSRIFFHYIHIVVINVSTKSLSSTINLPLSINIIYFCVWQLLLVRKGLTKFQSFQNLFLKRLRLYISFLTSLLIKDAWFPLRIYFLNGACFWTTLENVCH